MASILSPLRSLYRWCGPGGCLLLTAGLGLLTVVATTFAWHWRVTQREAEELGRLQDAGEPTTLAELDAYYSRPTGDEDLTASWLVAFEPLADKSSDRLTELRLLGAEGAKTPLPGEPWPELDAARSLLDEYRAALAALHPMSHRQGDARYELDLTRGIFSPMPHRDLVRKAVRLLTFEAGVLAYEGDVAGCVEALHAAYASGRTLGREPFDLALLVRIGCDAAAHEQLRRLLPRLDCSADQLAALRADVRAIHYAEGLQHALTGDRVLGLATFRDPSIVDGPSDKRGYSRTIKAISFGDLPRYLRFMDRLIQAARLPPPGNLQAADEIDREVKDLVGGSAWGNLRHSLLELHLGLKRELFRAVARGEASTRCAEVALAVEQFRRETGRPPTDLDELVPRLLAAVPTDPFDGQRLRYAVVPSGYRVYSVGPDGIDQGGLSDNSAAPPDLTFNVEAGANADEP